MDVFSVLLWRGQAYCIDIVVNMIVISGVTTITIIAVIVVISFVIVVFTFICVLRSSGHHQWDSG